MYDILLFVGIIVSNFIGIVIVIVVIATGNTDNKMITQFSKLFFNFIN